MIFLLFHSLHVCMALLENSLSDFVSFKDNSHLTCVVQKKDLSYKIYFMLTYYIFLCYYIAVILLFLIQS